MKEARIQDEAAPAVSLERQLLQDLFDVATSSLDFGSGFLDDDQVRSLREVAVVLGVDPLVATPANYVCRYTGEHELVDWSPVTAKPGHKWCWRCSQQVRVGVK